jgi:pseudaminic acid cytidylyltransferase
VNIAILPARGGSKRIPRKNIRLFCGIPILARTIATVRGSNIFDRIVVSTDDEEIAAVAIAAGAEVPFIRPSEISDDFATTVAVVAHAVDWLVRHGSEITSVCCVYPTAPFLRKDDLIAGRSMLNESDWDYVFACARFGSSVFRAMKRSQDGALQMFAPELSAVRTQDLEQVVYDAGMFYWGRTAAWLHQRPVLGGRSAAVLIPRGRAHDLDELDDWQVAEALFRLDENLSGAE